MDESSPRTAAVQPTAKLLPLTAIKEAVAGGNTVLYQDSVSDSASAFMFIPLPAAHLRFILRLSIYNCPTAAFDASSPEAFHCDLETLALDMAKLLGRRDGPVYVFGLSAGSIPAGIAASVMALAGRTVKLVLANPICQWWPQNARFSELLQKQYDYLQTQIEANPALLDRLTAQGEILSHLGRGLQHDLTMKIFVSQENPYDVREAKRLAAHTGADTVFIPTADHNVLPWFCRQINPKGDLYATMVERYKRTRPQDDMTRIEALAARDAAEMPRFWQRYPDLRMLSDAL
jgi:hypothetical protein